MNRLTKRLLAIILVVGLLAVFPFPRVHADADKAALQQAHDAVVAAYAAETTYWEDSFAAFESDLALLGGLAAVETMLADPVATQEDVDALANALTDLLHNLVTKAVHNATASQLYAALVADLTGFTLRSQTAYLALLEAVQNELDDDPRLGNAGTIALLDDIESARDLLQDLADKTTLLAAHGDATTIATGDGIDYTPSSFLAFQTAYAAFATEILPGVGRTVNAILTDPDASVVEAEGALASVQAALGALILRADKTALAHAYENAAAADLSGYTPTSAAAFLAGLDPIATILADAEAEQNDVDAAVVDLEELYGLLLPLADKADLALANDAAIIAFYEERDAYTSSSFSAFRTAVLAYGNYLAVNQVLADLDVTQTDVDMMMTQVSDALALLAFRGDVDELIALHTTLSAVDLATFTPVSVTAYRDALAAAWLVAIDDDTDQEEADAAVAALSQAPALLVPKADKTALAAILAAGTAVRPAIHSNSSYQILARLLQEGAGLMQDENATQIDVDGMTDAVTAAIAGLELRNSGVVLREGTGAIDVDAYVAVGNSSILSYSVSDPAILAIDAEGNVSGLSYGTATVTVLLANGITEEVTFIVKAKIRTATFIYALVVPLVAAVTAVAMILWNDRTGPFFKRVKIIRNAPRP